jgi:hypothetical protein
MDDLGSEVASERSPVRAVIRRGDVVIPIAVGTDGQGDGEDRRRLVCEVVGVLDECSVGDSGVADSVDGRLSTGSPIVASFKEE